MRRFLKKLLNRIPTTLPQGVTEFETWADDLIDTYDMPNNDSVRFALATSILHLKSTDAKVPKDYFGRLLIKGAASEIAGNRMQVYKQRQQDKIKAEQEAALATSSVEQTQ